MAGASHLPFMHLKTYEGSDLPKKNKNIKFVRCPYTGKRFATVPALNPDVAIIQVQRVDEEGNGQIWGLMGVQREAAFAAKRVIIVAEELVPGEVIRADPNRTLIPGLIVSAVVIEPFAAHPSYALGYYDRDNAFYVAWARISKDKTGLDKYLAEWVFGLPGRKEYREKLGAAYLRKLEADSRPSGSVNYGF
jgi:glutaconate CoA-transferase subunit A